MNFQHTLFSSYYPELPRSRRFLPKIRRAKYADGTFVWCVDWRDGTKRIRRFFQSRSDAREFAESESAKIRSALRTVEEANPLELEEAIAAFRSKKNTKTKHAQVTWAEWSSQYICRTDCTQRHRKSLSHTASRCLWKTMALSAIDSKRISGWIIRSEWSQATMRTYLSHISEILGAAVKAGHIPSNPCSNVILPKARPQAVRFYTQEECRRLLGIASAYRADMVPAIAIGMFAGLRPQSELAQLDWRDVRLEEAIIVVHSTKVRSASRRVVPILPALAEWLMACGAKSSGPVMPQGFEQARKRMIARAKFAWIPDGLRHTFASYRLADCEDAAKVALELGHANTKMLFAHYRALVTRSEAAAFWAIRPDSGGRIVQMVAGVAS